MRKILESGVDINLSYEYGRNPLINAAQFSNSYSTEGTVELLLKSNIDVDIKDMINDCTALSQASLFSKRSSSERTVMMLIAAGADVNVKFSKGCAALLCTTLYLGTFSTKNTIKILLEAGAVVELPKPVRFIDLRNIDVLMMCIHYA